VVAGFAVVVVAAGFGTAGWTTAGFATAGFAVVVAGAGAGVGVGVGVVGASAAATVAVATGTNGSRPGSEAWTPTTIGSTTWSFRRSAKGSWTGRRRNARTAAAEADGEADGVTTVAPTAGAVASGTDTVVTPGVLVDVGLDEPLERFRRRGSSKTSRATRTTQKPIRISFWRRSAGADLPPGPPA
jgi:hypothetical protein